MSPRLRRLKNDLKAIEQLKAESTILDFSVPGPMFGGPPDVYSVVFRGKGLWRPEKSTKVLVRERHELTIRLGAGYPRMMPDLRWKTPIFHPNISAGGVVCLGGYSTYWTPSLQLDELCRMLWDMIRYENYDVESPYNREAAQWVKTQTAYAFPLDPRPIRDRVQRADRGEQRLPRAAHAQAAAPGAEDGGRVPQPEMPEIVFVEDGPGEIVLAEIVPEDAPQDDDAEILFIE